MSLTAACGSQDDLGFGEAGSAELEDAEDLGALAQAISGGTVIQPGENVVNVFGPAVRLRAASTCSGVKIGSKRFLTAGHCFTDSRTAIQITNSIDGVFPATSFTITKQLRHPSHKISGQGNVDAVEVGLYDLKIIEIAEATDSIPIAKITPLAVADGSEGYISIGYGCDPQNPNNSDKKQKGEFNAELGAARTHVHYITEGRDRALCAGDSGGPLFRLLNGEMQVTGINAGTNLFTRIENTTPWILSPVVNVFTNNSTGQFMNLASASVDDFSPLNCAAMIGSGAVSPIDVKLDQCDGQLALYNGRHSVNWVISTGNTGAGFQKIISFGNGNCLGVDGASAGDANVSAITCAASTAGLSLRRSQAWKFVEVGQAATSSVGTPSIRAFNVINELSGKCLSTTGSTAAGVGSDVRVSTCETGRRDQKWVFTR